MKTFDDIWAFTDTIPGSFTRLSGEKLYEQVIQIPDDAWIVEIGVDQGRSASLLMNAAEIHDHFVVLIDSWESVLIDNMRKVENLSKLFPLAKVDIWNMRSTDAARLFNGGIALIHIDANHYEDNPANDCEAWLYKLESGGIACFHDYHESWPAVMGAVDKYCAGWEDLGVWDSLAIRRKP